MAEYKFVTIEDRERFNSLALGAAAGIQGYLDAKGKAGYNTQVKTNFVCSYEWGQLSKASGWQPEYVGVEENGELVATALLMRKYIFKGLNYVYTPRGYTMDYGNYELLRFFTESIKAYLKRTKTVYYIIDPDIKLQTVDIEGNVIEGEENSELVRQLEGLGFKHKPLTYYFESTMPRFTFRIPIDDELGAVEDRYSRTTKQRIKKAMGNSITVYKGEEKDVEEFIRLTAMTEERKDYISHQAEHYRRMFKLFNPAGMLDLYLAKINIAELRDKVAEDLDKARAEYAKFEGVDGKRAENQRKEIGKRVVSLETRLESLGQHKELEPIVSAYFITKYADKAWALYAANDMDYGSFYANYAVYQKQIEDMHAEGRRIFDVFGTTGRPTDDANVAGLYEFKKKWGGELCEFVGEFECIFNPFIYRVFNTLNPIRHEINNRLQRKKVVKDAK